MEVNPYSEPLINFDEGDKSKPYQDERGIWTIAKGHNMEANGLPRALALAICARDGGSCPPGDPVPYPECLTLLQASNGMTEDEEEQLYQDDRQANCSWLWSKPWWSQVDLPRQAALEDIAFNLGPTKFQAFTTFLGLVAIQDWPAAMQDLEFHTAVAHELPIRYGRLEQILATGVVPQVVLDRMQTS